MKIYIRGEKGSPSLLAVLTLVISSVKVVGEPRHYTIHIAPVENIVDIVAKEPPAKKSMTRLNPTEKKGL